MTQVRREIFDVVPIRDGGAIVIAYDAPAAAHERAYVRLLKGLDTRGAEICVDAGDLGALIDSLCALRDQLGVAERLGRPLAEVAWLPSDEHGAMWRRIDPTTGRPEEGVKPLALALVRARIITAEAAAGETMARG